MMVIQDFLPVTMMVVEVAEEVVGATGQVDSSFSDSSRF
ncbi:hypothetical protein Gotur_026179 [Gossypium turneri]